MFQLGALAEQLQRGALLTSPQREALQQGVQVVDGQAEVQPSLRP